MRMTLDLINKWSGFTAGRWYISFVQGAETNAKNVLWTAYIRLQLGWPPLVWDRFFYEN